MLRGLTTVNHFADDMAAAVAWYTDLFGVEPYYANTVDDQGPAYVEFRIGDYQHEFGILTSRFAPPGRTPGGYGTMTYWAVDDVEAAYADLQARGATPHLPPTEHGPGFVTASVVDPFGNVVGVMYNQHYLDTVAALAKA